MKEIILGVVIIGLFIFFFYFLMSLSKKKKEAREVKQEKPAETQDEKPEDIPEILKEITMGNYMHDVSNSVDDLSEVQMEENLNIEKAQPDEITKIKTAFDEINDLSIDVDLSLDEINEIEEGIDDQVCDYLNDGLEDDFKDESSTNEKSIAEEYKGLSKNMKALIIANVLSKKHK